MKAQPNVLFIMMEHTSARAIAPGSGCLTPHLDTLAAQGRRFSRCYSTNAICSPARASLMTGAYPSTHGIWDCTHTQPRNWVRLLPGQQPFFSTYLAEAGYRNGYFGKWHVEPGGKLEEFGWHEYDHTGGTGFKADPDRPRLVVHKPGYNDYRPAGVSTMPNPHHPAFDRGIEFMKRVVAQGDPFCCFISTQEPHDPYVAPEAFLNRYDLDSLPLSPSLKDDLARKPDVVHRMHTIWEGLSDADWRLITACYRAVISYIDAEIGRALKTLRELGCYDDTIVVLTADHGDMMGAHGLCAKGVGTPYEEVYNIPLIMRVPNGVAGGEDNQTLLSTVDLAPTLLDLCLGCALPGAQGRSFKAVLENRQLPADWQDAYAEFYGQRFVYTQRITWHGDWKYVFSPGGRDELYNLAEDPYELKNRAEDPDCRPILLDLCRRMWKKAKSIGDESLANAHYAVLRTAPIGPLSAEEAP